MMKRLTAVLMALTLLITLFGCAKQPEEKDAVDIFIEEQISPADTFVAFNKDRYEMEEPLTICMDLEYVREPIGGPEPDVVLNEFLTALEQTGGLSDVEILFVPKHGEEREIVLERIREEMMSGGGPDVFIVNCTGTSNAWNIEEEEPLFAFPEKAMENDWFLPLDEYMETHTRFAEWEKCTQGVLNAGRNEEGQQIIPLSYTMPILCFYKSDLDVDHTGKKYTWDDMLHDPDISSYARFMPDCSTPYVDSIGGVGLMDDGEEYLEYAFGQLADFWTVELSFTEEELLERVEEIVTLHEIMFTGEAPENLDGEEDPPHFCTWLGHEMATNYTYSAYNMRNDLPLTMLPLYTDDGGAAASILSWAAVNRNTDKPEEAYTVIDMLMRSYVQKNYWLYENYLCNDMVGIPLHEDILHPDTPFGRGMRWSLSEENYKELCEVRSQITSANFQSAIGVELRELLIECIRGAGYGAYSHLLAEENADFVSVEQSVHEAYARIENMLYE